MSVYDRWQYKTSLAQLRPKSVSIQLNHNDQEKAYLQNYLSQEADFEVYWGSTQECLQELWTAYAGG